MNIWTKTIHLFPRKVEWKRYIPFIKEGYHHDLVLISSTAERARRQKLKLGKELAVFQRNYSECIHVFCLDLMGICIWKLILYPVLVHLSTFLKCATTEFHTVESGCWQLSGRKKVNLSLMSYFTMIKPHPDEDP